MLLRHGRMFSDGPDRLLAADKVAPVAKRDRHEISGDDPTKPQQPTAGHVRRRSRVHAELGSETRTVHQDHHTRVQRQRTR